MKLFKCKHHMKIWLVIENLDKKSSLRGYYIYKCTKCGELA